MVKKKLSLFGSKVETLSLYVGSTEGLFSKTVNLVPKSYECQNRLFVIRILVARLVKAINKDLVIRSNKLWQPDL